MKKLIVVLIAALVMTFMTVPAADAAVTNCANNHVTLHTGEIFPQTGTVFYRDCNRGWTRWFEVYKVKGTFTDKSQNNCTAGAIPVYGGKLKFHLNSNGGVSYEPTLITKCVNGKLYYIWRNIDSHMGRTYPSHAKFGITFTQRNGLLFPDPKILRTGSLK